MKQNDAITQAAPSTRVSNTDARAAIASDRVTEVTRRALLKRLDGATAPATVLEPSRMRVLRALVERLVPVEALDLAARFEAELAEGAGDGWRYAELPPDREAHGVALDRLAAAGFADLAPEAQDALLTRVQLGDPPGEPWPFPSDRWFEELLAAVVRLAYGHPLMQLSIGYEGFADAHGMAPSA